MSKITREEVLDLPLKITLQIEEFWNEQGVLGLSWEQFINQQTTPKDIEEALKWGVDTLLELSDCDVLDITDNEIDFLETLQCYKQWNLTPTPQLSDDVEEDLNGLRNYANRHLKYEYSENHPSKKVIEKEIKKHYNTIKQHIQALTNEIKDLREIIIQQSDARNEIDNKLNQFKEVVEEIKDLVELYFIGEGVPITLQRMDKIKQILKSLSK